MSQEVDGAESLDPIVDTTIEWLEKNPPIDDRLECLHRLMIYQEGLVTQISHGGTPEQLSVLDDLYTTSLVLTTVVSDSVVADRSNHRQESKSRSISVIMDVSAFVSSIAISAGLQWLRREGFFPVAATLPEVLQRVSLGITNFAFYCATWNLISIEQLSGQIKRLNTFFERHSSDDTKSRLVTQLLELAAKLQIAELELSAMHDLEKEV